MDQINEHSDRDCGVRQVENGPDPEIQEIDHGTEPDPVDPVADGAAHDKA